MMIQHRTGGTSWAVGIVQRHHLSDKCCNRQAEKIFAFLNTSKVIRGVVLAFESTTYFHVETNDSLPFETPLLLVAPGLATIRSDWPTSTYRGASLRKSLIYTTIIILLVNLLYDKLQLSPEFSPELTYFWVSFYSAVNSIRDSLYRRTIFQRLPFLTQTVQLATICFFLATLTIVARCYYVSSSSEIVLTPNLVQLITTSSLPAISSISIDTGKQQHHHQSPSRNLPDHLFRTNGSHRIGQESSPPHLPRANYRPSFNSSNSSSWWRRYRRGLPPPNHDSYAVHLYATVPPSVDKATDTKTVLKQTQLRTETKPITKQTVPYRRSVLSSRFVSRNSSVHYSSGAVQVDTSLATTTGFVIAGNNVSVDEHKSTQNSSHLVDVPLNSYHFDNSRQLMPSVHANGTVICIFFSFCYFDTER